MAVLVLLLLCYHVSSLCLNLSNLCIKNKYLKNNLIGKTKVPSLLDCAVSCASNNGCLSFGFEPGTQVCHIHTRDSSSASEDLIQLDHHIHGDIRSFPSELWGPCKDHNCTAGQRCSVHRVKKGSYCSKAEFCPPPPEVSNSVISIGSQEEGSTRNYTCLEGYLDTRSLLTSAITTCLSNNTWSTLNLTCTEVNTTNVALKKPATSSSRYNDIYSNPSHAVDGSSDRQWHSKSCFSVWYADLNPWWQVDLQKKYIVLYVTITNRLDCCPERLHDFAIEVSNHFDMTSPASVNQLCYMYYGIVTAAEVTVHCTTPVVGRYVRVTGRKKLNYYDILQFCEFEVHGLI